MGLNRDLLQMAQHRVWTELTEKRADPGMGMPTPGGGPPAGPAGAAPAAGGAPTGPPGMSPTPPPPADPSMGMMQQGMQPGMGQPGMGQPGMGQAAPPKIKPEQWMQMLDYRMYNLQQQLTAIMNSMGVQVPAGALVMPPGTPAAPPAESAMPGGSADPTQQQGPGGGAGNSAIGAIDPIQGASPELAAGGGAAGGAPGGGAKAAATSYVQSLLSYEEERSDSYVGEPYNPPAPIDTQSKVAALAEMFRARARAA